MTVPRSILARGKQGFDVPLECWFGEDFGRLGPRGPVRSTCAGPRLATDPQKCCARVDSQLPRQVSQFGLTISAADHHKPDLRH